MAGAGAWAAPGAGSLSLDDAYLASELLQARSGYGLAQSAVAVPHGTATSAAKRAALPPVRIAARQPRRADMLDLEAISNDPDIKLKIAAAWAASKPDSADRKEQGFWICRDRDTALLYTRPFAAADSPRHLTPGTPCVDVVAFFHTHPFPRLPQGPSAEDEWFAQTSGLAGIIRARDGMHYFGPELKPWQPR